MDSGVIGEIITLGTYAPSGDNVQPWKFEVRGKTIDILNDTEHDHPFFNFRQRGTYVAHGALIETIGIAASHWGYAVQTSLFPDSRNQFLTARLELEKTNITEDFLFPYIKQRHTNRKKYRNDDLTQNERTALLEAGKSHGCTIRMLESSETRKVIAEAVSVVERIALETFNLHHHFFHGILWNKTEELFKNRGLYIKTLELPWPIQLLFRLLKSWPLTRILNKIGFSKAAAKGNAQTYATGAAFGILSTSRDKPEDFIAVGRSLQRMWLEATRLGMALQPVTGLPYLAQRIKAGKDDMIRQDHKHLITNAYHTIEQASEIGGQTIGFIFRIGRSDPPTAFATRLAPHIITR